METPKLYKTFLPHWKDFQRNLSSFPFLKGSPSIKQIVDGVFPSLVHSCSLPPDCPLCFFLSRERLTFQNTSFFLGRRTLYWILHSGEIMYAPMNLEIIVEYWNCMISYFMLSACRLIFQKIEFLEFNFFAFIIAPKMLHSFSFLLRSIFLTHLLYES